MLMKICIRAIAINLFLLGSIFMVQNVNAEGFQGESITYDIKPLGGKAEYFDFGLVDLDGRKVKLTVFKTRVIGFKDTERIYSDPETFLPIRVERDIKRLLGGENIVEEYDQKNFKVTISKYKEKKKISEQVISAGGPIHNATLLPFYLRKIPDVKTGWSFVFFLPQKYEVRLVSFDEIKVGEKGYATYHFISIPDKFEIWISQDNQHIPLEIKSKGGFKYALLMKEHSMPLGSLAVAKPYLYGQEEH